MAQLFRNNAFSNLGASLTNSDTTLTVTTGHGDRFPVVAAPDFFLLTLQDASNNIEIVRVTARTAGSDSMTIQRAQEGTSARAWNIGDVVELRLTASALNPLSLMEGASTAAAVRAAIDAAASGHTHSASQIADSTAVGRSVLTAADQAAARSAIGAPATDGTGATGTWGVSVTGNADTATNATNATNLTGTSTANVPTPALGSGAAGATRYLRGDRTWAALPGRLVNIERITTPGSGTYTRPANVNRLLIYAIGGGGGGTDTDLTHGGGGGGAGGYAEKFITTPATSYAYTVGAGGAGATSGGLGGSGASTTIAGITAYGGSGETRPQGGTGGGASGGDFSVPGGGGGTGSVYPGGYPVGGNGGASVFGGGGSGGYSTGQPGSAFGSGGGGGGWNGSGPRGGGNGAPGYIEIWEFE